MEKTSKYDSEATQARILKAAQALFAQKGFRATTTRMIAERAHSNVSLIARYFGGKEGLLEHILEMHISSNLKRKIDYPPQDTLDEELRAYGRSTLAQAHNKVNTEFLQILIHESPRNPRLRKIFDRYVSDSKDHRLLERIQRIDQMGGIKPGTSLEELTSTAFVFFLGLVFLTRVLRHPPAELEREIEAFVKAFHFRYGK